MRRMIREIAVGDLYLYFALPLALFAVLIAAAAVGAVFIPGLYRLLLIALAVPLYFVLKYLAIGCVLMYKAFAPEQVRESCRFEPTCSTYMIIAIKKYGLFRGVFRGVRRIMRCHPPNGGTDLP